MDTALQTSQKDWFLSTLNNIVNNNPLTIGITLVTQGFIISGHLTGGKEYFDAVADEFARMLTNSFTVEKSIHELAESVYGIDNTETKKGPLSTDYIHIKNARFYSSASSAVLPETSVWWRGRLSEISGFSIGVINETEDK